MYNPGSYNFIIIDYEPGFDLRD